MDTNGYSKRAKIMLVIVTLLVLAFFGWVFLFRFSHHGKVPLDIKVAPKEAVVTLNNKVVAKNSFVSPGTYQLSVKLNGFSSYSQTLVVTRSDAVKNLTIALEPQTADARKLASSETAIYAAIEGEGGQQAQQAGVNLVQNNPILNNIPYRTSYMSIDYGKDASGRLVIQISASAPVGRQVAIEKIRSWGFDPTDYLIEFVGLVNPFTGQTGGQ